MAIQKLNIQVQPHQPARAADFNATTAKVDELVDAVNEFHDPTKPDKILFIRGYTTISDADSLNSMEDIGIYYLVDGSLTGTLTVDYDFNRNVTQTLISPVTISYNNAGQQIYTDKPSVQTRTYKNGSWSRWVVTSGSSDITVDASLSDTSENPVQNKVVTQALAETKTESQQYTDTAIEQMASSMGGSVNVLTLAEYYQLKDNGNLKMQFYAIYKNGTLNRMYFNETLFARKAEEGETISSCVFPLVFPIVFA